MKFEHLMEINDPLNPLIDSLTQSQLWNGLVQYVEDPVPFVESLDSCMILSRHENGLQRELTYGQLKIRDAVTLSPQYRIHIAAQASTHVPAGSLTLTIESPTQDALFVRFQYETFPAPHQIVETQYEEALKSAYVAAGIDIIQRIREYAIDGRLDYRQQ